MTQMHTHAFRFSANPASCFARLRRLAGPAHHGLLLAAVMLMTAGTVELLDERTGTLRHGRVRPQHQGRLSKLDWSSLYQGTQSGIRAAAPEQIHAVCADHGAHDRFSSGRERRHGLDQAQVRRAHIRRRETSDIVDVGFQSLYRQISAEEQEPDAFIKRVLVGIDDCNVCHSLFLEVA
jgi:hypothetical protein